MKFNLWVDSMKNNIQKIDKIECILLNKDRIFQAVISELNKRNIHFNNILDVMSKIPLASNGKKYLRLNKYMKIVYSLNVIPESPINVVVDATNAMFLFHKYLSIKNVITGYNVDLLEDAIDAFFYFLEYNNLHIHHNHHFLYRHY